jgi:hypothetical protein
MPFGEGERTTFNLKFIVKSVGGAACRAINLQEQNACASVWCLQKARKTTPCYNTHLKKTLKAPRQAVCFGE